MTSDANWNGDCGVSTCCLNIPLGPEYIFFGLSGTRGLRLETIRLDVFCPLTFSLCSSAWTARCVVDSMAAGRRICATTSRIPAEWGSNVVQKAAGLIWYDSSYTCTPWRTEALLQCSTRLFMRASCPAASGSLIFEHAVISSAVVAGESHRIVTESCWFDALRKIGSMGLVVVGLYSGIIPPHVNTWLSFARIFFRPCRMLSSLGPQLWLSLDAMGTGVPRKLRQEYQTLYSGSVQTFPCIPTYWCDCVM
jgi:hypothetical protein